MFARPDLLTGPRHATASLPMGAEGESPAALPLVKRYPLPCGLRRVWGAHRSGKRRLSSRRRTTEDAGCRVHSVGYGRSLRHTTTRTRSDRCWQATLPKGGKDSHPRFRRWPWCWFHKPERAPAVGRSAFRTEDVATLDAVLREDVEGGVHEVVIAEVVGVTRASARRVARPKLAATLV